MTLLISMELRLCWNLQRTFIGQILKLTGMSKDLCSCLSGRDVLQCDFLCGLLVGNYVYPTDVGISTAVQSAAGAHYRCGAALREERGAHRRGYPPLEEMRT
jgi:hypothetical protein